MVGFVAQRIVKGIVVLLAIVVLNFFLIRLAPGDPLELGDDGEEPFGFLRRQHGGRFIEEQKVRPLQCCPRKEGAHQLAL